VSGFSNIEQMQSILQRYYTYSCI